MAVITVLIDVLQNALPSSADLWLETIVVSLTDLRHKRLIRD